MTELLIAVALIVSIKHFLFKSSKSFNSEELKELIESRSSFRARARKHL